MLVHEPEITTRDGRIRVEARIESESRRMAGLDRLWFDVDASSGLSMSDRADPFLVALISIAMACREAIEVRGRVSPRLAWGVRELQRVHHAWWPRPMSIVDVRTPVLEEPPHGERGGGVATSFSGGVDSMNTVWNHTREREAIPGFRLTHAVMVQGFDAAENVEDAPRFERLRAMYAPFLSGLGVDLVILRTNLRAFRVAGVGQAGLLRTFGTALVAPALTLSRTLGRIYLPGAHGYAQFFTDGSQPSTDHLLSTEAFHTIHDGAEAATRFEKVAVVARWPEALARLCVCSKRVETAAGEEIRVPANCGACGKCVRTMTTLEILGARTTYPIFPRPLTRKGVRWAARLSRLRALENLRAAVERRRPDIARDLRLGLLQERFDRWSDAARGLVGLSGRRGAGAGTSH